MKNTSRALGLLLAALVLAIGLSSKGARAQSTTEIVFCNNTGSDVFIAMAYWHFEYRDWYMYAWQKQYPGECRSIGSVGSGLVYYFAEKDGRRYRWPADAYVDRKYCVPDYGVNRRMFSGNCPRDERLLGFRGVKVNGGRFTINLDH